MDEKKSGIKGILNTGEAIPTLFEVVPPQLDDIERRHRQHCDHLELLFERHPVTAINIPEIHDESQKGEKGKRRSKFRPRVSPREYAKKLRRHFDVEFVVNRVTVQASAGEQEEWLIHTHNEFDIQNIVLVGGELESTEYENPSVPEMNRMAIEFLNAGQRQHGNENFQPTQFTVGNICIPTRRLKEFDEPDRMWHKMQSGASFFTTQIVLDRESPVALIRDLSALLDRVQAGPPTIFWSFTPIATQKDVDFLRWLGVEIPDEVSDRILSADDPVEASIEWAETIWRNMLETNRTLSAPISMGLNISVMGLRNFENGIRLVETLGGDKFF